MKVVKVNTITYLDLSLEGRDIAPSSLSGQTIHAYSIGDSTIEYVVGNEFMNNGTSRSVPQDAMRRGPVKGEALEGESREWHPRRENIITYSDHSSEGLDIASPFMLTAQVTRRSTMKWENRSVRLA